MDYQRILNEIEAELKGQDFGGEIATYIPELAKVNPHQFGAHLCDLEGNHYFLGANEQKFSIQSISKVLTLALAYELEGEKIFERVDVEPSGDPFNSLVQLEYEHGIPRNPLINSGALVICDILISSLSRPKADLLAFIRELSGSPHITFDEKVAASEMAFGNRNAALANLIKAFGNIQNPIEELLDFYFHSCSIAMSCKELAQTFLLFANHGKLLHGTKRYLSVSKTKRINAIMQTCGFYDEAGEFSFRVGLPGKSGVGGGIAAVHPGEYSIAVWSPRLNPKGNSAKGMAVLELLTTKTGRSIF